LGPLPVNRDPLVPHPVFWPTMKLGARITLLALHLYLCNLCVRGTALAQVTQPAIPPVEGNGLVNVAAPVDTRQELLEGRNLLEAGDPRSVPTLRAAAQSSLQSLATVLQRSPLTLVEDSLATDVVTIGTAQQAAEAHYYWGLAADKFAQRDEAITALARAARIARAIPESSDDGSTLRRDTNMELGRVLRDGLPLVAPDDTLDAIAVFAHGGLWTPRRIHFDPGPLALDPSGTPVPPQDFLITDGKLFPPVEATDNGGANLVRIPPLYSKVSPDSLPVSLLLDKMVVGYARELDGPNRGQWRQVVRVFYASTYNTKNKRNDLPRAEAMCMQFLKIHALVRSMLGLSNLYARGDRIGGVTTLWLLEVSALWPNDEDDPEVLQQLGPQMPAINTGATGPAEPEITPISRPWAIAGQVDASPGDILFWKAGLVRPEAEWLRELAHEYGHVALPPFGGYEPPLEPYGNGKVGETLGMLWAAAIPGQFVPTFDDGNTGELTAQLPGVDAPSNPPVTPGLSPPGLTGINPTTVAELTSGFTQHVSEQALPCLSVFREEGPLSEERYGHDLMGEHYLQGLCVYLERVYGARLLGRALQPLAAKAANITDANDRRTLMNTSNLLGVLPYSWQDMWGGRPALPIWLPGAIPGPTPVADLINRAPGHIVAGSRGVFWLFVPSECAALSVGGANLGSFHLDDIPATATPNGKLFRVNLVGRSGWIPFHFSTGGDVRIDLAQFEHD